MRRRREPPDPSAAAARRKALELLSRRDYTPREIRDRLVEAGFEPSVAEGVAADFQASGLADEEKVARAVVQSDRRKGKGRAATVRKLVSRGVVSELASSLAREESPEDEAARIVEAMRKKARTLPAGLTSQARSKKLFDHLVRRGFAPGTVLRILREKGESLDDDLPGVDL